APLPSVVVEPTPVIKTTIPDAVMPFGQLTTPETLHALAFKAARANARSPDNTNLDFITLFFDLITLLCFFLLPRYPLSGMHSRPPCLTPGCGPRLPSIIAYLGR